MNYLVGEIRGIITETCTEDEDVFDGEVSCSGMLFDQVVAEPEGVIQVVRDFIADTCDGGKHCTQCTLVEELKKWVFNKELTEWCLRYVHLLCTDDNDMLAMVTDLTKCSEGDLFDSFESLSKQLEFDLEQPQVIK